MRNTLLSLIAIILLSCNGSKDIPRKISKLDRTNPQATTLTVLSAYKEQDLKILKLLSTDENIKIIEKLMLDQEIVEGRRIFSNWRWEMIEKWDGTIKDIRKNKEGDAMYLAFFKPADGKALSEVGVVKMTLEGGQWCFDDIQSPTKMEFERLPKAE